MHRQRHAGQNAENGVAAAESAQLGPARNGRDGGQGDGREGIAPERDGERGRGGERDQRRRRRHRDDGHGERGGGEQSAV
jgi:hypothetical protein